MLIKNPFFLRFKSPEKIVNDSYFYLHTNSHSSVESTRPFGDFVKPFSGTLIEIPSLNFIAIVSPSIFVIIVAVIILCCIVNRKNNKKKKENEMSKNSEVENQNQGESVKDESEVMYFPLEENDDDDEFSLTSDTSFESVQIEIDKTRKSYFYGNN